MNANAERMTDKVGVLGVLGGIVCALVTGALLGGACGTSGRTGSNNNRRDGGAGDGGGGGGGCQGLACFQKDCGTAPTTTVSGRVTAPNGIDPVFEALVYVPSFLPEFPKTVQCEVCNEPVGGVPIVQTKTDINGDFVLSNVPVSAQVPVVVQKGRFRRTTNMTINGCTDNPLAKDDARLPKNQSEGDLPKMAVGVGNYDQIECVLRSIGIDESEFTGPAGNGAVHLYDNGGSFLGGSGELEGLLNAPAKLQEYNILFINCTGNAPSAFADKATWKSNMNDYVNAGGRLYVTDWSYDYMEQVPEFAPYIYFAGGGSQTAPQPMSAAFWAWTGADLTGTVVDGSLTDWLTGGGAITGTTLPIHGSYALAESVSADQVTYPSKVWVEGNAAGKVRPYTATFDYNSCGKVLWSSYHTQEPGGAGESFPSYCKSTASTMTAQEKVLEYLIFEISSCVGPIS